MTREEKERIQQKLHRAADAHLNAYGGNLYYEGVARGLEQAAGIVGKVRCEEEPQWIPCGERLPEEYGNYLATMNDGDVQECTYSPEKNKPFMRGGWSTCEADGIVFLDIAEVIAWMSLPEPYEEEKE